MIDDNIVLGGENNVDRENRNPLAPRDSGEQNFSPASPSNDSTDVELADDIPSTVSTVEEFERVCARLEAMRCHIGDSLSSDAKKLYGPTWYCSKRIMVLFRWSNKKKNKTFYDPEESALVLGPRWYLVIVDVIALTVLPVLNTIAYIDWAPWIAHVIPWILYLIDLFIFLRCVLVNPGIVRRRRDRNLLGTRPIKVLLPVPNCEALRAAQRGLLDGEEDGNMNSASNNVTEKQQASAIDTISAFFDNKTMRIVENDSLEKMEALKKEGLAEVLIGFCQTCRIYRGPRTRHCGSCNCCFDVMDHHCSWTGSCMGKNNYRYFVLSLFFLHVLMVYILIFNLVINFKYLFDYPYESVFHALKTVYFFNIVIYCAMYVLGIFISGLLAVHVSLLCRGVNTAELLRRTYEKSPYHGVIPWIRGNAWKNFKSQLFGSTPLYMHSEAYYCITIAALIDERKITLRLSLPKEEQERLSELESRK